MGGRPPQGRGRRIKERGKQGKGKGRQGKAAVCIGLPFRSLPFRPLPFRSLLFPTLAPSLKLLSWPHNSYHSHTVPIPASVISTAALQSYPSPTVIPAPQALFLHQFWHFCSSSASSRSCRVKVLLDQGRILISASALESIFQFQPYSAYASPTAPI